MLKKKKDGVSEVQRKDNGQEVVMGNKNMKGFSKKPQISLKRAGGHAVSDSKLFKCIKILRCKKILNAEIKILGSNNILAFVGDRSLSRKIVSNHTKMLNNVSQISIG